jgi:hypothetical protein
MFTDRYEDIAPHKSIKGTKFAATGQIGTSDLDKGQLLHC